MQNICAFHEQQTTQIYYYTEMHVSQTRHKIWTVHSYTELFLNWHGIWWFKIIRKYKIGSVSFEDSNLNHQTLQKWPQR